MSHSNAFEQVELTRSRANSASSLLHLTMWQLESLRSEHPALVGDLPERLAVLTGLVEQREQELWEESHGLVATMARELFDVT